MKTFAKSKILHDFLDGLNELTEKYGLYIDGDGVDFCIKDSITDNTILDGCYWWKQFKKYDWE